MKKEEVQVANTVEDEMVNEWEPNHYTKEITTNDPKVRWSDMQQRPNAWYAEYLHAETHDNNEDKPCPEELEEEGLIEAQILEYVWTQYSLNKGFQICGEKGEHATNKELKQLHDMATFEPIDPNTLTEDENMYPLCF